MYCLGKVHQPCDESPTARDHSQVHMEHIPCLQERANKLRYPDSRPAAKHWLPVSAKKQMLFTADSPALKGAYRPSGPGAAPSPDAPLAPCCCFRSHMSTCEQSLLMIATILSMHRADIADMPATWPRLWLNSFVSTPLAGVPCTQDITTMQ